MIKTYWYPVKFRFFGEWLGNEILVDVEVPDFSDYEEVSTGLGYYNLNGNMTIKTIKEDVTHALQVFVRSLENKGLTIPTPSDWGHTHFTLKEDELLWFAEINVREKSEAEDYTLEEIIQHGFISSNENNKK